MSYSKEVTQFFLHHVQYVYCNKEQKQARANQGQAQGLAKFNLNLNLISKYETKYTHMEFISHHLQQLHSSQIIWEIF